MITSILRLEVEELLPEETGYLRTPTAGKLPGNRSSVLGLRLTFSALTQVILTLIFSSRVLFCAPPENFIGYTPVTAGSYESWRFLSSISGHLQLSGWKVEILDYVARPVKDQDQEVHGENLVAYTSQLQDVKNFLIVPCDSYDLEPDTSSHLRQLVQLALKVVSFFRDDPTFGIVLVSGHYQNGAGMQAMLQELSPESHAFSNAIIFSGTPCSGNIPQILVSDESPVGPVKTALRCARQINFPLGVQKVLFGDSRDLGESFILRDHGIDSLTLSFPKEYLDEYASQSDSVEIQKIARFMETMFQEDMGKKGETSGRPLVPPFSAHGEYYYPLARFMVIKIHARTWIVRKKLLSVALYVCSALCIALAALPAGMLKKRLSPSSSSSDATPPVGQ